LTEALSRLEDAAGHNWDTYVQTYLDLAFAWYHDALGETWEVERHLASAGIHAAFCGNGAVPIPANAGGGLRLDGPTGEAVCDVILTPGEAMRLDFRAADWKHRPLVRYGLRAVLEVDPDHPAPSLELRNDRCETDDGGTAAFTVACTDIAPTGRIWLRVADEFGLKTALVRILVQPFPIMLPDAPHRSISLTHIEDVLIRHLLGPRCISATIVKQFGGGLSGARVLLVEPRMSVSRSTSREPGFDVKGQLCIIKTGPRGAIMAEGERYERYVHDILGGNASHVASKTAWADHGGLRLNLVDEPDGGAARDEASWLPVNQTSEGRRLLERVFREDFGTNWYRQKADSPTARLLDFQARFMPPLLRLRDLPSGEGLSYDRQPQQVVRSFIEDGLRCPGPSRPFDRGAVLHLGSMRIDGFFHEDDGTGPAWRYRLTRPEDGLRIDFLSPIAPEYMEIDGVADHLMGKPRFVTGEVDRLAFDWLFERQSACISAFNELQQEAELGYEDDGRSLLIRFASGASRKLPNPLWSLHDLAVMNLRCRRSIIHGDMHTRNVIVGRAMHYYIDFEFAGVGPTLYDFIKHEFVLWSWNWASWPEGPRPPECTLANALRLMDALADPSDPFPALHVALSLDGPPSWIHRMFELIAHLRQLALEYVEDRGSKRDYFAPLCLHSTLALRWYDPSRATSDETRLAVAREGLILNLLAAVLLDRGIVPGIGAG
jgi:hypothetical protein